MMPKHKKTPLTFLCRAICLADCHYDYFTHTLIITFVVAINPCLKKPTTMMTIFTSLSYHLKYRDHHDIRRHTKN